jgi:hypothetical protein
LLRAVSPSTLLRTVSLSNGRWTFYEAVNNGYQELSTVHSGGFDAWLRATGRVHPLQRLSRQNSLCDGMLRRNVETDPIATLILSLV